MTRTINASLLALFALALVALLIAPHALFAQSANGSDDLRATVRAELLSDPRSAGLTQAQLDAMVDALATEAQKQGMTSHDITWRPAMAAAVSTADADSCGSLPGFLCNLNRAFGFDGSDPRIPIGLGISSALLLLVIGLMIEMRHHRAVVAAAATPPAPQPQSPRDLQI